MAGARGADTSATKKSLSKNVLQMKFMVRGKEQDKKESGPNNKKQDWQWFIGGKEQVTKKMPYSFDASYVECEELLPYGRMSFLKFNPVIEKKHRQILKMANQKLSGEREDFDGISDEEMAERYETLVGTVAKKFSKKRKRGNQQGGDITSSDDEDDEDSLEKRAKRGFIKPRLEDEFEF